MEKCELGDYPGLVRLFQRNPDIDVNSVDALGRNALRLAIKNEHLEIVEFLLDRSKLSDIQQSALLSINLGHIQVAQCILTHRRYLHMWHQRRKIGADEYDFYQRASNPATEDNTSAGSGGLQQFSEDTTPIILAAQKNMYKIVQLLLDRGEVIQIPHKYNCQCTECMNRVKFDHLRAAKMRLNTYKGLASEAYITLSSKDPILRAFTLSKELRSMANTQKFFKKDYNTLAANLSNYVVSLLDQIQNQEELELIVNKVGKSNEENYEQFGRLKLALRYGEKKVREHSTEE
ncbi:short transient receptor potential channel 6-like, partial [Argonauta hians]